MKMKLAWKLMLAGVLSVTLAGVASAAPIVFQLDNVTTVGAAFPSNITYTPSFSIVGSGNIDLTTGIGTVSLPNYSMTIDVIQAPPDPLDAQVDISGWQQTITANDGFGNLTSTGAGTAVCTILGGLGGFICPSVAPTIGGWPPNGGVGASAVIDTTLQTITVIDSRDANAGTVTQYFSYSVVPEPTTALLFGTGLLGLGIAGRRRE